jgi:hypothetical protein
VEQGPLARVGVQSWQLRNRGVPLGDDLNLPESHGTTPPRNPRAARTGCGPHRTGGCRLSVSLHGNLAVPCRPSRDMRTIASQCSPARSGLSVGGFIHGFQGFRCRALAGASHSRLEVHLGRLYDLQGLIHIPVPQQPSELFERSRHGIAQLVRLLPPVKRWDMWPGSV